MKELMQQYAAYNAWANKKLVDAILALPEEQAHQEVASSFKNLHLTLLHMWDAESIWWQRVRLQEHASFPSVNFKGTVLDAGNALVHQSELWKTWVHKASEPAIQHVFQYHNTKREFFKQPVFQVLLQMFNHSTYHRGQLITMLHQLGAGKLPNTDFIAWVWNGKK